MPRTARCAASALLAGMLVLLAGACARQTSASDSDAVEIERLCFVPATSIQLFSGVSVEHRQRQHWRRSCVPANGDGVIIVNNGARLCAPMLLVRCRRGTL